MCDVALVIYVKRRGTAYSLLGDAPVYGRFGNNFIVIIFTTSSND